MLTVPVFAGVLGGGAVAQASPAAVFTPADVADFSCTAGSICFYSGRDGTGDKCQWSDDDPNWNSGSIVCSWADEKPVASVYNHGQDDDFTGVAFYSQSDYRTREGCTRQGQAGNLSGDYKVASHRWIKGSCG
jgi:hypothetical protein